MAPDTDITGARRTRAATGLTVLVVLGIILGSLRAGHGAAQSPPPATTIASVPGELLVGFAPAATASQRQSAHAAAGATVLATIPQLVVDRVRLPAGVDRDQAIQAYQSRPGVAYAEVVARYQAALIPNDTWYPAAWGLPRIGAPDAWNVTRGSGAQTLAVLDTGIDANHNDLLGRVVFGINTVGGGDLADRHGHGTHVAAVAAAAGNDRFGVAGVTWNSLVLAVKVLDDTGAGTAASVAAGIVFAVDYSALVINTPFAGPPSRTLEAAVEYARARDVLIVAAAGNDNAALACPACYPSVLAVGATTQAYGRATFSNHGAGLDLVAPGEEIIAALPVSNPCALCHLAVAPGFGYLSGTSQASAFAAGAAMLVLSRYPDASAAQVAAQLTRTATPAGGFGAPVGLLQLAPAVYSPLLLRETPTPLPTPIRTASPSATATTIPTATPPPSAPMFVSGVVRRGASVAPPGSELVALISNITCGRATVAAGGSFSIQIASAAQTPGCGTDGATVTWTLAGAPATPAIPFRAGGALSLTLTAAPVGASPTATDSTTPPPTASPTRTPTPTGSLAAMTVTGRALIGGRLAPGGTPIEARVGGQTCGASTIQAGAFTLTVASADQSSGCGLSGAAVTFHLGGAPAQGSLPFTPGATRLIAVWR